MKRLLVLTAGELTRDPRARRAVQSARSRDWEVLGLCISAEAADTLEGVRVTRIEGSALDRALRGAGLGGMRRSPMPMREIRGIYRLLRHAAAAVRLFRAGRRLGPVDVIHANDFDTLPAGRMLASALGARLVYDAHEIYTQQDVDPPRLYVALVVAAERFLAARADAVITVNEQIADELRELLRLDARPIVVMNCAALDPSEPDFASTGPLRVVYQGAIGPGRFLDDLFALAERAPGIHLTLRVKGADITALRRLVGQHGLADHVEIADPVAPSALVEALRGYHVGVMINRRVTRNDEFALPNKLFEYLMAGLAVVGPDLPSLRELIDREEVGMTFPPGDVDALAKVLIRLDEDRELLSELRQRARRAAVTRLNAESQADQLELAWTNG